MTLAPRRSKRLIALLIVSSLPGIGCDDNTTVSPDLRSNERFVLTVYVFQCKFVSKPENQNLKWVKLSDLENLPMGKVDREITKLLD